MFRLINKNKQINLIAVRYLHDRKLPEVTNTLLSQKTKMIATSSPRKADFSKIIKNKNENMPCKTKWQNLKKYGWFTN